MIHFSGELKMWDRDFFSDETDNQFAARLLRNCSAPCFKRWVERTASDEDYLKYHVRLVDHDNVKRMMTANGTADAEALVSHAVKQALGASELAVSQWRTDLESLFDSHPDLGGLSNLLHVLGMAANLPYSAFWPLQPVEMFWAMDSTWYPAVVKKVHENCRLDLEFVARDWWGVPSRRLHRIMSVHV